MSLDDRLRFLSRRDFLRLIGGASAAFVASACDSVSRPPPSVLEPCPFNPAVEYALGEGLLSGYDVSGFGTGCLWDPTIGDRDPLLHLTPHTIAMLHWMDDISRDPFYSVDQVQSLVSRFGEGIVDPETGQRVTRDVGLVNEDEYLASRDLYEQAKRMHEWAALNEHRADSIKPVHYRNFNAWSVRMFGWPFPEPEFDMPLRDSRIEDTGLEPNHGFAGLTPMNWGLDNIGTDQYAPENFLGLEGKITGNAEWLKCNTNVENVPAATQIFSPNNLFLYDEYGLNVLVQSKAYRKSRVTRVLLGTPGGPVDWSDITLTTEHVPSATLFDTQGEPVQIVYAHIGTVDGGLDLEKLPKEGQTIGARETFAYLNSTRGEIPLILLDMQAYVPSSLDMPGISPPWAPHRKFVDMFFEGYPVHQRPGFNDIRFNRHDTETNYARAIGNRSAFSPCAVEDGEYVREPR